jgi:hypothetical protein
MALTDDGVRLSVYDPKPGDTCRWQVNQKVSAKWKRTACGAPAHVRIALPDAREDGRNEIPICKKCLAELASSVVACLLLH